MTAKLISRLLLWTIVVPLAIAAAPDVLANGLRGHFAALDPALRIRIQEALNQKGYRAGPANGANSPRSLAALLKFAADNQIEGDDADVFTPKLAKLLLGIDLPTGEEGADLTESEEYALLKRLGIAPADSYRKNILFPD